MSTLAAALGEAKPQRNGSPCFFAVLLPQLDDIDRQAVTNALHPDSGLPGEQLAAILTAEGHPVRGYTVMRHRQRRCSCDFS